MRHGSAARPVRAGVALGVLAVSACGGAEHRDPVDFERMRQQQRADLYEPSGAFPDGKVMQAPPPGTIAREAATEPAAVVSGTVGGSHVPEVPIAVTPSLLAEGRERFAIYCAACHGAGGFGGSVVAANMDPSLSLSLRVPHAREYPAGYVFEVITSGTRRMPSYAWALSVRQRWAVVAYMRALQMPHVLQRAEVEDSLAAAARARLRSDTVEERP